AADRGRSAAARPRTAPNEARSLLLSPRGPSATRAAMDSPPTISSTPSARPQRTVDARIRHDDYRHILRCVADHPRRHVVRGCDVAPHQALRTANRVARPRAPGPEGRV